jgi:transporter family-2 protein
LAGQMVFSLFADTRGLFGLPQRTPEPRDYVSLSFIITGSLVLIFFGSST